MKNIFGFGKKKEKEKTIELDLRKKIEDNISADQLEQSKSNKDIKWNKHQYVNVLKCAVCGHYGRGVTLHKSKILNCYYCEESFCSSTIKDEELKKIPAKKR